MVSLHKAGGVANPEAGKSWALYPEVLSTKNLDAICEGTFLQGPVPTLNAEWGAKCQFQRALAPKGQALVSRSPAFKGRKSHQGGGPINPQGESKRLVPSKVWSLPIKAFWQGGKPSAISTQTWSGRAGFRDCLGACGRRCSYQAPAGSFMGYPHIPSE